MRLKTFCESEQVAIQALAEIFRQGVFDENPLRFCSIEAGPIKQEQMNEFTVNSRVITFHYQHEVLTHIKVEVRTNLSNNWKAVDASVVIRGADYSPCWVRHEYPDHIYWSKWIFPAIRK